MSAGQPGGAGSGELSEEELRAAYESEIKRLRVEHVVLEQVVSLINLGMRRTGLSPGTEDERDLDQVKLAIDAVRALVPLVEPIAGSQIGAIRDALSQLQLAYVRLGGTPAGAAAAVGADAPPGGGGGGVPGAGDEPAGPSGGGAPGGGAGPGPGPGAPGREPAPESPKPGEPGPAQRSGRLWVPGQ